jgi:predicted CXXCH cytochrome family protein
MRFPFSPANRRPPRGGFLLAALALLGLLLAGPAAALSKEDKACLSCHDQEGFQTKLANGEVLKLHVPTQPYADSVHNSGCTDCHAEIDAKAHPDNAAPIPGKRAFVRKQVEACANCHEKKVTEYASSVHAALQRDGHPNAPLCSDCHNPHAVQPAKAPQPMNSVVCRSCHQQIYTAYAASVHGQAKAAGKSAPLCADCHRAHDVAAASVGDAMKQTCLSCHKGTLAAHQAWLPNSARHLDAISCPACHSPKAERRVNLRLYDGVAKQLVTEKSGVPQFKQLATAADASGQGLDARALWSLLQGFNQDGDPKSKTVLRGRLETRSGVEAHGLMNKAQALSACDACHREGAAPFQSVTVSIVGPDGRPVRHGAQKDVLNSLVSIESVGGFYAIGATRIKLLDTMLVLVLAAGVGVPLGHLSLKKLSARWRARQAAQAATARAAEASKPKQDE